MKLSTSYPQFVEKLTKIFTMWKNLYTPDIDKKNIFLQYLDLIWIWGKFVDFTGIFRGLTPYSSLFYNEKAVLKRLFWESGVTVIDADSGFYHHKRRWGYHGEDDVSAEEAAACKGSWISCQDGNSGRPQGSRGKKSKGQEETDGISVIGIYSWYSWTNIVVTERKRLAVRCEAVPIMGDSTEADGGSEGWETKRAAAMRPFALPTRNIYFWFTVCNNTAECEKGVGWNLFERMKISGLATGPENPMRTDISHYMSCRMVRMAIVSEFLSVRRLGTALSGTGLRDLSKRVIDFMRMNSCLSPAAGRILWS